MKTDSQTQRIFDCLIASHGVEISSVHLHRVGSGNPNGWVNSLSRRISDCRTRLESLGQCIPAPRKEVQPDGSIHTFYKVVPVADIEPLAITPPGQSFAELVQALSVIPARVMEDSKQPLANA